MLVVAGLSLKNWKPEVWRNDSPYYLSSLRAVMVSYADFFRDGTARHGAMDCGLRAYLGVPKEVDIYLDNGSFYFLGRRRKLAEQEYDAFVSKATPTWRPIPRDYIPTPDMSLAKQRECLRLTMDVNRSYQHNGYVPVVHVGLLMDEYLKGISDNEQLAAKPALAIGGMVPNLLRASRAIAYRDVLAGLSLVRQTFRKKRLHVFGVGGTATVHLAFLLGMDSVDSSGWRNRAARGIIQLPGSGDRMVAELGKWRGRRPSDAEWDWLYSCSCPACHGSGVDALKGDGIEGFCRRATHNLWVLLEEARWITSQVQQATYLSEFKQRLNNSIYLPLVEEASKGWSNVPGEA